VLLQAYFSKLIHSLKHIQNLGWTLFFFLLDVFFSPAVKATLFDV
jgi:hypothetical protein